MILITYMSLFDDKTNIYLLGDSVLDNFFWLKDKQLNLTNQLRLMSMTPSNIMNFAVDENETKDVLHGKIPPFQYSFSRSLCQIESYPTDTDGRVYPLKLIKQHYSPNKKNIAILSVGGNDARINLHLLPYGWQNVWKQMQKQQFVENYVKIIEQLNQLNTDVILVFVYKPYQDFYPQFQSELFKLMANVKEIMSQIAKKYKLPMIDLSMTFDPTNPTHYGIGNGSSPIEPSNQSSQFIANLIKHVIDNYQFRSDQSYIYYGHESIEMIKNH